MEKVNKSSYDIIVFYSYRDIEDKLKWFDRMYNVLLDQITTLESVMNSFEDAEDRNGSISKAIRYQMNRKGQGDSDLDQDENVKEPLVLSAFHETEDTSIPDIKTLIEDLMDNRIKVMEIIDRTRIRIRDLKAEIFLNGRAVILIVEPIWEIFGFRYLYTPQDAMEFFALKGEANITPFTYYDPYFSSVYGATFGNIGSTLDTL